MGRKEAHDVRLAGLPGRRREDADPAARRASTSRATSRCSRPGRRPHTPLDEWGFTIGGAVDEPRRWTWEEFRALPSETITVDIHCVTKWSKLDTVWRGVSLDTLLDGVETSAEYVPSRSATAATRRTCRSTDLLGGKAWIAYEYDGEPLEPEHGGPARLLVPHLYFWKSAKWVRGLELRDDDEPGFWESYGYHNYGDPWREQRYCGRLSWQLAHGASTSSTETPRVREHRARRAGWPGHRAGQHVDVRLTAEDGYQAQRSYSIASAPEDERARADGRAARRRRGLAVPRRRAARRRPARAARPDRRLLRLGASSGGPLAAGRRRLGRRAVAGDAAPPRAVGSAVPARLLYSARTLDEVIYRDELTRLDADDAVDVRFTLTREQPRAGTATRGGSTGSCSRSVAGRPSERPLVYVCGPTAFVETAASDPRRRSATTRERIRTERFGPTGRDGGRRHDALDGNAIAGLLRTCSARR